jgi:inosine triphosphate pyrophosphatase
MSRKTSLHSLYSRPKKWKLEFFMHIAYVTSNRTKFDEATHILYSSEEDKQLYHVHHTSLPLDEIQGTPQEIAFHKAKEAQNKLGCAVIIDDISVSFPALQGLPGPYIKSFLEALGEEGLYTLISHYPDHTCYATCTIGFLEDATQTPLLFEYTVKGQVVPPRGNLTRHGKVSWNSIVIPEGSTRTFAEMTLQEVSTFSPRGKAVEKFKEYMKKKAGR